MADTEFPTDDETAEDEYIRSLEHQLGVLRGLMWEMRRAKVDRRNMVCHRKASCLRPDGHPGDCFPSMVMI